MHISVKASGEQKIYHFIIYQKKQRRHVHTNQIICILNANFVKSISEKVFKYLSHYYLCIILFKGKMVGPNKRCRIDNIAANGTIFKEYK